MQHDVKIPSLGESIVSGVIVEWNFKSGDVISPGDVLYELETDKITSQGIADVAGVIEVLAEVEEEVAIGQVVARIDTDITATSSPSNEPDAPTETAVEEPSSNSDEKYPPSVERLAAQTGINPESITGTGKDGRVTKEDMLNAGGAIETTPEPPEPLPASVEAPVVEAPAPVPAPEPVTPESPAPVAATPSINLTPSPSEQSGDRVVRKKMTPIRKKIAERLVSVKNEAAILTTFNEVDMSAVMKLRKEMQEDFSATHGIKLGFMSFFVKAAVSALKAVPAINAKIEGNEIVTHNYYDISVAVGTDRGLVVPVLRDCDQLSFADIENQLNAYANQAKEGSLAIEDMQGGVFTLSNGGVYGSLLSTPIINPPQSGILGMHTIQERPVAVDGKVEIRPMMYLALSYDHRIVDGKEAVTFLINIKKSIENPSRLMFGI